MGDVGDVGDMEDVGDVEDVGDMEDVGDVGDVGDGELLSPPQLSKASTHKLPLIKHKNFLFTMVKRLQNIILYCNGSKKYLLKLGGQFL